MRYGALNGRPSIGALDSRRRPTRTCNGHSPRAGAVGPIGADHGREGTEAPPAPEPELPLPHDLLCFSHLRWDFVYQRPNHLMTRAAADRRVFFVEEPLDLPVDGPAAALPRLDRMSREDVSVVVPRLPATLQAGERAGALAAMIDGLVRSERIERPVRWYYTPMSLPWSEQVPASAVVYDCMDDLSGFRAPPAGLQ